MADQTRKRRSARNEQIPQRVENAAQNMYASSGPRRGYVPGGYAPTGTAPQPNGWDQTGRQPGGQPSDTQRTYTGGYGYQQQYGASQSQMTGAQHGFRMQAATPPPPKKKKSHAAAVIIVLLVLVALGTGGYFAATSYLHDKKINEKVQPYDALFCPNVYVDGIHLGGMTPEQAMNSVQSQIQQRHDAWKVQLTWNGSVVAEINSDMLGFNVDPAQVMNEAWQQGHTGDKEQRYEQMTQLEQEPYVAYTAKPDGDTSIIDTKLNEIKKAIDQPATDAVMTGFDPSLDYPFTFTDETYGRVLNIEPIKERLYQMVSTMESGMVELQPERLEPNVRKADLMKHYMLRSSVYTPIDKHSTDNRNMNIAHAFDYINGYVLEAGKTFSFNNVVGERTEARGFYPAIEYVYGEHVEGFGGGVCQASTTLYQAAVCAGLQVLKREPHSDSVSYAEYGKDATVYWVGKRKIDLTFKNTTDDSIYIVASVEKDPSNKKRLIAKVSMYGQDMGDVRYELQSEITETLPAPFNPVYVKDTNGTYVTYKDQQESVSKAK
ncbi:MAG: VanW family protein, partial [Clostridia bacterium]|nr:VanW family protein [Clostridia bacterium]